MVCTEQYTLQTTTSIDNLDYKSLAPTEPPLRPLGVQTKSLITLMMEAASTSVNFYQTTRRYNPEDSLLQILSEHPRPPASLSCFCFTGIQHREKQFSF
jgi:hypothetical protein